MEIIKRIANGVLIVGASTVIGFVSWLLLYACVRLVQILVIKRTYYIQTRLANLLLLIGCGLLLIFVFWQLGGLQVVLR